MILARFEEPAALAAGFSLWQVANGNRMPAMKLMSRFGPAIAVVACLTAAGMPQARAQVQSREGIALQNQILELRRDLQQTQSQQGRQGSNTYRQPPSDNTQPAGSSDINAQLLDRVTQLEDQVRALRGRIDEVDNARQRQGDDLNKQIGDLGFRLDNAGGAPAAPTASAAAPGVPPPTPPPPHRTPEIALAQGNAALLRHDYPAAEAAAREVIAAGHGPRLADGQFLLAQSRYGRRDFQGAAVAYDDAYARNPRGNRAPDSLLGLATSLTSINEKPAACETLNKLRVEFPQLRGDLRPLAGSARQRAGCGG